MRFSIARVGMEEGLVEMIGRVLWIFREEPTSRPAQGWSSALAESSDKSDPTSPKRRSTLSHSPWPARFLISTILFIHDYRTCCCVSHSHAETRIACVILVKHEDSHNAKPHTGSRGRPARVNRFNSASLTAPAGCHD